MTHTTRALELLFQAIREVESREELGRLSATARELYGGRPATGDGRRATGDWRRGKSADALVATTTT